MCRCQKINNGHVPSVVSLAQPHCPNDTKLAKSYLERLLYWRKAGELPHTFSTK